MYILLGTYVGEDDLCIYLRQRKRATLESNVFLLHLYIFIWILICDYESFALITVSLPVAVDWITVKLSANEEARDDQEQKGAVPRLAESAGRLKLKKKDGGKEKSAG